MKFLTQLNRACVDICRNMIRSAEMVGIDPSHFIVACLDDEAHDRMKDYPGAFLYGGGPRVPREYQKWSLDPASGFRLIVRRKFELIKMVYDGNRSLCWVDSDMVFKKNPMPHIVSDRILFQSDSPGPHICSGFMVFNDSPPSRDLISDCGLNLWDDDQILVNMFAQEYAPHIRMLDTRLFPNGYWYYRMKNKEDVVMVHNNYIVGLENKVDKFKDEGLWFV